MNIRLSFMQLKSSGKHFHPFNPLIIPFIFQIFIFLLMVEILSGSIGSQCYGQPTVRENLSLVSNSVHSVASDAKLVFATGDDLTLAGGSGTWIYIFKSESKNRLYEYWYDDGEVVKKSSISKWEEFVPSINMEYLPDTWLDSDEIISIAESKGGSSFRAANGGNAAIVVSLTPAASGSSHMVPLLFPCDAWGISYRYNDTYFDIAIDCQTGEVIKSGKTTAKEIYPFINNLATEFASDAKPYQIWSPTVDLEGKAEEWNYEFHSISRQKAFFCVARNSKMKRDPEFSPEDHKYTADIEISDSWMDSDSAIIKAIDQGLENFQHIHPNGETNLFLSNNPPGMPTWVANYYSPTGYVYYNIPAINIEGLHNASQTFLSEVKALAKTYATDAELIFVYNVPFKNSITGDGEWHYVFKSESQQELYEFYTTLTGYIGIPENVTEFFSREDFFKCQPFPDSWLDIGSALDIAEKSGGTEFRQNCPDWKIVIFLFMPPDDTDFKWEINYVSENSTQHFQLLVDATAKSTTHEWPRTYGGSAADIGQSVQETKDGGFIIAGYTRSYGQGMADTWLIKTDSLGNLEWDKTHGGENDDYCRYVEITENNEYLVGHNCSDASGIYAGNLLLTYDNGMEKLGRGFGNSGSTEVYSIHKTADQSYIMAGSSSAGDDKPTDFWLVKIDENGDEVWNKIYGGVGDDICESMEQTSDGGYILLGHTNSYGAGGVDFWLVKTDAEGNKIWDNTYGGGLNEEGKTMALAPDGGFILAGFTESFGSGQSDAYLVKTDEFGNEEWSRTYGSEGNDVITGLIQTTGGDIIMVGTTDMKGNKDVLVIKTDSAGNEIWTRTYGEKLSDIGRAICETSDGNFILTGGTRNYGAMDMDLLLMKIDNTGTITEDTTVISENVAFKASDDIILSSFPNPFSTEARILVDLKNEGQYKLRIVDISGREIVTLLDNYLDKGKHSVNWNCTSHHGSLVKPGIYIIELVGVNVREAIKIIVR